MYVHLKELKENVFELSSLVKFEKIVFPLFSLKYKKLSLIVDPTKGWPALFCYEFNGFKGHFGTIFQGFKGMDISTLKILKIYLNLKDSNGRWGVKKV